MKKIFTLLIFLAFNYCAKAQLADSCKLRIGNNLGGLADWSTEQAFVDMMHYSRTWYTKDVGNPNASWNSELADELTLRNDGYPTQVPQVLPSSNYSQKVATIWGATDGWEPGNYIVLFDGIGNLSFGGNYSNLNHPTSNRYTFSMSNPANGIFELVIDSSNANNPIHNIRIIKDSYENTYLNQPFNPMWLEKLSAFKSVRFMDWGQTNNWGLKNSWEWDDTTRYNWDQRAKFDYYTWTTNKGVPYEMMVKLMNDYHLDAWVCVPHSASNQYIREMARYFRDNLNTNRKLTVEYSNETWNWMFGQTQWLNKYGCVEQNIPWPEGTAPYIQNCLDIWTQEWAGKMDRLTRVAAIQTGWLDVAQRVIFNLADSSYDAVGATYYFGISDSIDQILDTLANNATVTELSSMIRENWYRDKSFIQNIKDEVADSANKKLIFYEGGQHITPIPFGSMPTYANVLLDIQRDTAMYNLYNEWFDFIRSLQSGTEPVQLMNFSFISSRSAQYGSWGILENQYQDTSVIYAPKYQAVLENQNFGCEDTITVGVKKVTLENNLVLFPNPTNSFINIASDCNIDQITIYNMLGQQVSTQKTRAKNIVISVTDLAPGIYSIKASFDKNKNFKMLKFVKQ